MSNHRTTLAALDAAIDMLANVRIEMQTRHDETIAAIKEQTASKSQRLTLPRLLRRW